MHLLVTVIKLTDLLLVVNACAYSMYVCIYVCVFMYICMYLLYVI